MVALGRSSAADPLAGSVWLAGGLGVLVGLLLPWVRAQALDNAWSRTGIGLLPWTITTAAAGIGLVAAGLAAVSGKYVFSRFAVIAAATLAIAAPVVCLLVSEIMQSALPGWVAPVGDTSELLTIGAGSGVWLTCVSGVSVVTFALMLPANSELQLVGRTDWVNLGLRVAVPVAAALLIAVRPASWVDVRVAEIESTSLLPFDAPTISLAISDLPVLGPASFVAAAVLLLTSIAVVVRASDVLVALLGTSAFVYLFCLWIVVAVVDFTAAVVPRQWITVDGAVLADAQVSSSTWWVVLLCSICLASSVLSRKLPALGPHVTDDEVDIEFVSRFDGRKGTP